jgi:hypothetical protein
MFTQCIATGMKEALIPGGVAALGRSVYVCILIMGHICTKAANSIPPPMSVAPGVITRIDFAYSTTDTPFSCMIACRNVSNEGLRGFIGSSACFTTCAANSSRSSPTVLNGCFARCRALMKHRKRQCNPDPETFSTVAVISPRPGEARPAIALRALESRSSVRSSGKLLQKPGTHLRPHLEQLGTGP